MLPVLGYFGDMWGYQNNYDLVNDRIVGGGVVNPKYKYPYQVFYRAGGDYICGGTIINKNHVITAGHCVKDFKPNSKHFVIVGHHRINKDDVFRSWPDVIFGANLIRIKFIKWDRNY